MKNAKKSKNSKKLNCRGKTMPAGISNRYRLNWAQGKNQ